MTAINQLTIDSIIQENSIGEKAYQFAYTFETDINIKTVSTIDSLAVGLLLHGNDIVFKKLVIQ